MNSTWMRGLAAITVAASLAFGASPAAAGPRPERHCISPHGFDVNEFHQTNHRVVTHFCPVAFSGEHWIPMAVWIANFTHEVIPDGYVPSAATPIEDFNGKVTGVRYVIDAGTRQQRVYKFRPAQVLHTGLSFPVGGLPTTGIHALLKPLPVGSHTVDIFVTLSADHWDGFDIDPAADLIPAGETHWDSVEFDVQPRGRG